MFNFVVDRLIKGRPYPNLAQHPAEPYTQEWREFGQHYPNTVPLELINHCEAHAYPFELVTTGEYIHSKDTRQHWYPIQFGFFSFELDYILLLPPEVRLLLADTAYNLRILFYYHEGDNPERIKARLDYLCIKNNINNPVAAAIGSLVYSYNTYFFEIKTGHITLLTAFTLFPLVLFLFQKTLEKKSVNYALLAGLTGFIVSFYEFRAFYILCLILILYAIIYIFFVML